MFLQIIVILTIIHIFSQVANKTLLKKPLRS